MRSFALGLSLLAFAACQTVVPLTTTPSFTTSPALSVRNPADIAVLPVEDGTAAQDAARHLEHMRLVLQQHLPDRRYSPVSSGTVDAALRSVQPARGESVVSPAYLKRVAGKAPADALLAVRVDRWDETKLLADKRVVFAFSAALVGADGELLWNGSLVGDVKAGGLGAAPRDKDQMARSCAELALAEVLNHLSLRQP